MLYKFAWETSNNGSKFITYIWQLNLLSVHEEIKLLVEVLTLTFQHVFGAVAEVDQLVDNARREQVKRRLSSLELISF